jgi:hypothetical protein
MSTQPKVLTQLKILETLYHEGNLDTATAQTLDKIIDQQRTIAQGKKAELEQDIQIFETQYAMSSADFYRRFHAGELGDGVDFVEWNAFYEMRQSLDHQIQTLQVT